MLIGSYGPGFGTDGLTIQENAAPAEHPAHTPSLSDSFAFRLVPTFYNSLPHPDWF